ncbi:MAG: hypothetical protein KatS3mg030_525 [Saprospiraceae bacterium]|nr:MAG: hypothetical protein KatS3mg030_525 [Saprospiraceae bacterium]
MKSPGASGTWAGAGLLAALAASLCCITPVLALLAGTSGMAASFSWLEPARPYLIGLTVAALGLAWWQKLRTAEAEVDCACEEDGKVPFLQTKTFLGIVTVFAALMLAFPHYAHIFYPKNEAKVVVVKAEDLHTAEFQISGMTCTGCEEHIEHAVLQVPGVVKAEADYHAGKAIVAYDQQKTSLEAIASAIDETGYKVIEVHPNPAH